MKQSYFVLIDAGLENLVYNSKNIWDAYGFTKYYLEEFIGLDDDIIYKDVNSLEYDAKCKVPYLNRQYKISLIAYFHLMSCGYIEHACLKVDVPSGVIRIQLDIDYNVEDC